eukprot:Colp12_sorted_trinity150504_noHs@769
MAALWHVSAVRCLPTLSLCKALASSRFLSSYVPLAPTPFPSCEFRLGQLFALSPFSTASKLPSKRVTSTNNLLAKYPSIAAEWHPTKNGDLTPKDVAGASHRKVWWQCKEGHEWEAFVRNRSGHMKGCRQCFVDRQKGAPKGTQSLLAAHPDLAQQW